MRSSHLVAFTVLAACSSAATTTSTMPTAAPTNGSIATAIPIPPGGRVDFVLPCDRSPIFFGPFAFQSEGETLAIDSSYRSDPGTQICGGGGLVDGSGVQVTPAGLGCAEGAIPSAMALSYAFTPGAGGSSATPLFLELRVVDPAPSGCVTSRGTLTRR